MSKVLVALVVFLGIVVLVIQAQKSLNDESDSSHEPSDESQFREFQWSQGTLVVPVEGIFSSYRPHQDSIETRFSVIYDFDWNGENIGFQLFADQDNFNSESFDFALDLQVFENSPSLKFQHLKLYNKSEFLDRLYPNTSSGGWNPFFLRDEIFVIYESSHAIPAIYSPAFDKIFLLNVRNDNLTFVAQFSRELESDLPKIITHIQNLINEWKQ